MHHIRNSLIVRDDVNIAGDVNRSYSPCSFTDTSLLFRPLVKLPPLTYTIIYPVCLTLQWFVWMGVNMFTYEDNSIWDQLIDFLFYFLHAFEYASFIVLIIIMTYTIWTLYVNSHTEKFIKTISSIAYTALFKISEWVTESLHEDSGALHFRKQVHALTFEHKIISKLPQNMRFPMISTCTFMCGDRLYRNLDITYIVHARMLVLFIRHWSDLTDYVI